MKRCDKFLYLSVALACQIVCGLLQPSRGCYSSTVTTRLVALCSLSADSESSTSTTFTEQENVGLVDEEPLSPAAKNERYISSLISNLTVLLDKWICTGSRVTHDSIYNLYDQIQSSAMDEEQVKSARRLISRANIPAQVKQLGQTDMEKRREEAIERQRWEQERTQQQQQQQTASTQSRSALGKRNEARGNKLDNMLLNGVDSRLTSVAEDRKSFEQAMQENTRDLQNPQIQNIAAVAAAERVAEIAAKAGGGVNFSGDMLGIGGLDDVLAQVKRRVWVPLAAPPQLLKELGILPVRGLLLYGRPGCGKTLMARQLGRLLSPLRPITVVSGPEILDKFVGSSEKNLREVFDNPPDIYDTYRLGQADKGEAVAKEALHVIVMDEFDAIARTRGGRGGSGEQGDAGVARDSVVNQMLAKMDGFDPPVVPTLVIGLTNKRSLIEPALLRPGRFEVQIEVPPPSTQRQRMSILRVHSKHMHQAGRLLVTDAPEGSVARMHASEATMSYDELLYLLGMKCDGFSGASIAGVCRAAASHALERAVEDYATGAKGSLLTECLVTVNDFEKAVEDVIKSSGDSDWTDS